MLRKLAVVLLMLPLSGCIDAEVTIAFTQGSEVKTTGVMQIAAEAFGMMGKTPEAACPDGKGELTDTVYTCTQEKVTTVDDLIAQAGKTMTGTPEDLARAGTVTRLENGNIRVSFDMDALLQTQRGAADAQNPKANNILRQAVAGHNFTLRVSGPKIVSTTGELSADGLTATRIIPVATFLDPKPDFGAPFVTEVQVQVQKSCFLWVFCGS